MSLKAKLEAVIYAAEEPVTLAQLSQLFAAEALAWKAEQEAASAAASNPEPGAAASLPLLHAELEFGQTEQPAEPVESADAEPAPEAGAQAPGADAAPQEGVDAPLVEAAPEEAVEAPADLEAESKRLARQRDRAVRLVLRTLLDELIATYASDERGIEIKEIAGGFRMATKPECHDAARMFIKSLKPALKLSLPALETLAVIAYKQPITAPEVNEIRGVDSSGVFGSLLARKLIATAGRKQVIGRPILYKTTKEFLLKFGLNDVAELPSMEEFEKMAQLEFEGMEAAEEEAAGGGDGSRPEVDDDPDEPVAGAPEAREASEEEDPDEAEADKPEADRQEITPQEPTTAATADSHDTPALEEPETTETHAETPATQAATTPAEAAPAPPFNLEHAETETVPHD